MVLERRLFVDDRRSIERFGEDLEKIFSGKRSVVFLCGPSMKKPKVPGVKLRKNLEVTLKKEGFEVVLGEDDGLEEIRNRYSTYAHENELLFIEKHCNCIILIASSVGAYCELGLFSYKKLHGLSDKTDFVLVLKSEVNDPEDDRASLVNYQVIPFGGNSADVVHTLTIGIQCEIMDLGTELI